MVNGFVPKLYGCRFHNLLLRAGLIVSTHGVIY